jgi:hypothetical protein
VDFKLPTRTKLPILFDDCRGNVQAKIFGTVAAFPERQVAAANIKHIVDIAYIPFYDSPFPLPVFPYGTSTACAPFPIAVLLVLEKASFLST